MFKTSDFKRRAIALATVAAFTLAAAPLPVSSAKAAEPGYTAQTASQATDISARKRYRRHYSNNAAAMAFMGMALGTVGGLIAEQQRRDYYRQNYYYGGPAYYGGHYYGQPGYYGGGPYYGY
jgi:hypothetical protein